MGHSRVGLKQTKIFGLPLGCIYWTFNHKAVQNLTINKQIFRLIDPVFGPTLRTVICGLYLWTLFAEPVCGPCLRTLFADLVCGPCLRTLFADPVCGPCLRTLFANNIFRRCLWTHLQTPFKNSIYGSCFHILFVDLFAMIFLAPLCGSRHKLHSWTQFK